MIEICDAAENALLIRLDTIITNDLPRRIRTACAILEHLLGDKLIELVPAYTTILLYHHPLPSIQEKITTALQTIEDKLLPTPKTITLPVYYHESVAPDLSRLAQENKISVDEVITLHSSTIYQVYAVGFAPAFAYLGMVDSRIARPRLDCPRPNVHAGSVGIANNQTAVYPVASPAGWNIIGRTPIDLSLNHPDNLHKFSIGDNVKFEPIDTQTFLDLGGELQG